MVWRYKYNFIALAFVQGVLELRCYSFRHLSRGTHRVPLWPAAFVFFVRGRRDGLPGAEDRLSIVNAVAKI